MMKKNPKNDLALFNENGIDVQYLLRRYWYKRYLIVRVTFIFFILSILFAFLQHNTYVSSTTLVPQSSSSPKVGGSLGGLAAMAGINLGGLGGSTEISPILYPKIFESLTFRKELLKTELDIESLQHRVTFKDYYLNYYDPGVLSKIAKYTIGLPGVLITSLRASDKEVQPVKRKGDSLARISDEEQNLLAFLSNQVNIEINDKEGFIKIKAEMPEPLAAAEVADRAKNLLQQTIIEFQIEKANYQLEYLENRLQESKQDFEAAQTRLASFTDRNLYGSTARSATKLERLQAEYDLTYSVYSELSKQVESQRLQVKKDTPVFTIIESPIVPSEKAGPNRIGIIVYGIFLGVFFSCFIIFCFEYYKVLRHDWYS